MSQTTWLFVREGQSIYVERERGHAVVVSGPGRYGMRHEFRSEQELLTFQEEMGARLANRGWSLRSVDNDRRSGDNRQSAPRASAECRRRTDRREQT